MKPVPPALMVFCLLACLAGAPRPAAAQSPMPSSSPQGIRQSCPAPDGAPVVTSHFTDNAPKYNINLSSADLGHFHIDTKVSRAPHETFRTGGLTESAYSPTYNIQFLVRSDYTTGLSCLYINELDLDVVFSPVVYIASEFRPGSCRYTDTMRHERRHVDTTIITLKEYLPQLAEVARQATAANAVTGPFNSESIKDAQQQVSSNIRAMLAAELDTVDKVHFQRQQAIDTRQEYMRATRACPNEPLP
ncbi:MAG: hypothetical protein GC185_01560 [Alphaproteobacteria bacterium]|nr:hypothetical protein [Alphaproteobacteria bacterium]